MPSEWLDPAARLQSRRGHAKGQVIAKMAQKYGWNNVDFETFMVDLADEAGHRHSAASARVVSYRFAPFPFRFLPLPGRAKSVSA